MRFVENVIPTLHRSLDEGQRVALVTLIGIDGSSPRPIGSQLGVIADGHSIGMITGGCAEKAIVAEALRCIECDENKIVRYGAGSPYVDVVLPCGSGIELFIETQCASKIVHETSTLQKNRELASMTIDVLGLTSYLTRTTETVNNTTNFVVVYEPDYRIFAFGEGTNLVSFCTLATAAGVIVKAYSPDMEALEFLNSHNVNGHNIHSKYDFEALPIDKYTAVVMLFHEHEWERNILHAALNSQADYIGALGSRLTHKKRLELLGAMPSTKRCPNIIHGPVGLDIGAKNPNEIAVSIIAEIIEKRRRKSS